MKLRVWNIINVPNTPSHHYVQSVEEAKTKIKSLINSQLHDPTITDNVFGLEQLDSDGEWSEWYDEYGDDILEVIDQDEHSS